jgi:anti-sigma B factor antagonist
MSEVSGDAGFDSGFRIDDERPTAGTAVLAVHGEADLHSAPELKERLRAAIDSGVTVVVVDLTRTDFIDSTSLGVLLGATKRLREQEGEIRLVVSRPELRRIFEITLLDRVFQLHDTREEALAAVPAGAAR